MADKSSLNIAMLGHKRMLSREGGIEIVVKELATRLAACGHKVVCYDRKGGHVSDGKIEDIREYRNVQIVPVWTIERKGLAAITSSLSAAIQVGRSKAVWFTSTPKGLRQCAVLSVSYGSLEGIEGRLLLQSTGMHR